LDALPLNGTFETDEQGLMIVWGAGMHALTGIPTQEALGQPVWDVRFRTLPEKRKTAALRNWLEQGFRQLLETGHWQVTEQPLRVAIAHPDGYEYDAELIVSSLETASGYRILGTCLKPDLSGLPAKATQAAYQSLIEHSLQGVVIFQGWRLVYANEVAAKIAGYSQDELLSFSARELIGLVHPSNHALAWRRLRDWIAGRDAPVFQTYRYQHPDGSLRWLQVHTSLISRQGKPALQAAFLDVTAHKAAEDALRRALEQERRTREMMLALGQAAQAVLRARTAPDVYRVIGEQVRALGFHAVVLMLIPDTGQLEVSYGTYTPEMQKQAEQITQMPMLGYRFVPPPGGYYDRILVEKQTLYDNRPNATIVEALHESHASSVAQLLDIMQRIGAPLLIEGHQVRGILIVNGSGLREEDVPAVSGFANQTAIALENAERIAEGQRQREALRALSARLVRVQEAEQARIARELHDETGQTLTAMSLHLTQAIQDLTTSSIGADSETLRRLVQTRALTEQTTRQIRDLCARLRPSILDEMGLVPALRWLTNWFARQFEIQVRFRPQGADARLPGEVETTLYRIAQEGLTNVVRYAQAEHVSVDLKRLLTSVHLTVEDDGVGFDMAALPGSLAPPGSNGQEPIQFDDSLGESMGLLGMQERVRLVDGQLDVHSQPGQGTRLSVTIPLERG